MFKIFSGFTCSWVFWVLNPVTYTLLFLIRFTNSFFDSGPPNATNNFICVTCCWLFMDFYVTDFIQYFAKGLMLAGFAVSNRVYKQTVRDN